MNTLKFGNGEWYGKKDTILAYNDENSNYKPLPFNFERDSKATVVNKDGLIETVGAGMPRIDYKDNTEGALLLEPSRTNSLPYSANFSTWSATGGASVIGDKLGVGGSNDAFEFFSDGTANTRLYYALSNTGELSFSVFAKKNTLDYIALYGNGGSNPRVWFNLANGTLGNQEGAGTGSIESYGNGWYRCTMNWTSASLVNVRIYNSSENDVFGGTAGSVFMQYAQLEAGSYPTSYIPTSGSTATRYADECSQTVPDSVIGQTEGTLFVDADVKGFKNDSTLISVNNGTFSEYIVISGNVAGQINAYIFDNSSQQAGILSPIYSLGKVKCALSYSLNSISFYINGTKIGSDTSATIPTTSILSLGSLSFFTAPLNGKINQSLVYNRALTDQELKRLTQ